MPTRNGKSPPAEVEAPSIEPITEAEAEVNLPPTEALPVKGAAAKKALIQAELKSLSQSGQHRQGYPYATVQDILDPVRKLCSKYGCSIEVDVIPDSLRFPEIPSCYHVEGKAASIFPVVTMRLSFTDGETGEQLQGYYLGSTDPASKTPLTDVGKTIRLAQIYGTKIAVRLFFLLPEGEQPEDASLSSAQEDELKRLVMSASSSQEEAKALFKQWISVIGYQSMTEIPQSEFEMVRNHISNQAKAKAN